MLIFCWTRSGLSIFARHQSYCFFLAFAWKSLLGLVNTCKSLVSLERPCCALKGLVLGLLAEPNWAPGGPHSRGSPTEIKNSQIANVAVMDYGLCSYGLWIMEHWFLITPILPALLEILASIGRIPSISGDCRIDFLSSVIAYLKEVPFLQTKNQKAISQK